MMEIMIALVIAAVLSAVAVPGWTTAMKKRAADRALAALMTISECIKQYKIEYRLSSTPVAMKYQHLYNYGCVSPDEYPKHFTFPAAADSIPTGPLTIPSEDGTRMVCVTDIGNLDASAPVYFFDAPGGSSCVAGLTGYYRKISEDQIGKQRGS